MRPNVTNGYYVLQSNGLIELTSNITEDTVLGDEGEFLKDDVIPKQGGKEAKPPKTWEEKTPEERMLEAVMGFEGGNHPIFRSDFKGEWKPSDDLPPDDPFSEQFNKKAMAKALTVKFDDKLWETEEIQPSEVPEELKESGAINVSIRDVKNSVGKDRVGWKLALEGELNPLMETGAVFPVRHMPRGVQVLPMKVVLTLKPQRGTLQRRKSARMCMWKLSK